MSNLNRHPLAIQLGTQVRTVLRPDLNNVRIGVVGYGYWGPNIVRNLWGLERAEVVSVCDLNEKSLHRVKESYPNIELTTDYNDILSAADIDAVAVITPFSTHFELARKALENGKHVFVEKPFTNTVSEGEQLIELADRKGLKIMVDHTFLFTGSVRKIKKLVEDDVLGDLYYYDSMRVNLGLFQHDVNVLWDLAPHDLSILDYVIKEKPQGIAATGESHLNGYADVAYITVYYPNNVIAHLNVNWLSPVKVRTTLIGGEKKMLVWNDLEVAEKIKVYDRGIEVESQESVYDLLVSYRSGDMWAPKVDQSEALKRELEYFLDCILEDKEPFNNGRAGLKVVQMLEAADRSLKRRGEVVDL